MSSENNLEETQGFGITRRKMIVSTAAAVTAIAIAKVTGLEAAGDATVIEQLSQFLTFIHQIKTA